ncbi:DegT/DnrJ/EryC1/StrS family aminotransferase [Adhaeribacter pallidiroseus]|uniref:UDP-2-acetamido-2-deoxy-ribo-hexuluronate aminotransferase n=1 Tax=Adhaeribacter pallidiroseus TaxID=2072847 RepID=A0A369QEV7_9BACT|nr:DegT/DnrJ/EryC1/StrS family aminotransferase [Adhaeribacter pallidiroseus]RDC62962.1 UDP-2-acetamido-2-deoxy-ribo-hexuluronate aminotransferase [Adhaeribacter pallidiroseus]
MRLIQMVDLKTQYEKIKDDINASIFEVINNSNFINGPQVKEFAQQLAVFNKVKKVIPCANGTDALQIAMMALGYKPGDEIILPVFTYVATAEVIALLGLRPVFVDVDPLTFNIDPNKIKEKISARTKAIVPVHLFGQCADMEAIMQLATDHCLDVIEDAAQAIGAEYYFSNNKQFAGTIGTFGTTSFFPSKNLGCYGDGGALFTNKDELAKTAEVIANHGQVVKYHHDVIGINSRLDTLQAGILLKKLPLLNNYIDNRRIAAAYYDEALKSIPQIVIPYRSSVSTHVFHQYTIKVLAEKRDALKNYLAEKEIPTMVYYPLPLHWQNAYKAYNVSNESFPVSESISGQVLSLPIHTELDQEQLEYITANITAFFN